MDHTPSEFLYRVFKPLNWVRQEEKPTDGETFDMNGERWLRGKNFRGVSFFTPKLGKQMFGLPPDSVLPGSLRFSCDGPLSVPLRGKDDAFWVCGTHWTLYSCEDIHVESFEDAYNNLMTEHIGVCTLEAPGLPGDERIDDDRMATDVHADVCVMALEALSKVTDDPNVRFFSMLYATHIRAVDLPMAKILSFGAMAEMVATALMSFTVRDPMLSLHVVETNYMLADILGSKPALYKYKPFWV